MLIFVDYTHSLEMSAAGSGHVFLTTCSQAMLAETHGPSHCNWGYMWPSHCNWGDKALSIKDDKALSIKKHILAST